jgi:hypothetical protein
MKMNQQYTSTIVIRKKNIVSVDIHNDMKKEEENKSTCTISIICLSLYSSTDEVCSHYYNNKYIERVTSCERSICKILSTKFIEDEHYS